MPISILLRPSLITDLLITSWRIFDEFGLYLFYLYKTVLQKFRNQRTLYSKCFAWCEVFGCMGGIYAVCPSAKQIVDLRNTLFIGWIQHILNNVITLQLCYSAVVYICNIVRIYWECLVRRCSRSRQWHWWLRVVAEWRHVVVMVTWNCVQHDALYSSTMSKQRVSQWL